MDQALVTFYAVHITYLPFFGVNKVGEKNCSYGDDSPKCDIGKKKADSREPKEKA